MRILPVDLWKAEHVEALSTMLSIRGMDKALLSDLPQFGLIAFEHDKPVAAGFMRRIEGPYAMLDSYISNKNCEPFVRNRALGLITAKLVKIAKTFGVAKLLAFSSDPNTYQRSLDNGFTALPHKFSAIDLTI